MSTLNPIEKSAIQSLTLRSAAAIAIAAAADRLGVILPDGAAQDVASALIDLVVTLGLIGVAIGRTRARTPII
jgi:cadmium resistance protein CadD (predicted permease)